MDGVTYKGLDSTSSFYGRTRAGLRSLAQSVFWCLIATPFPRRFIGGTGKSCMSKTDSQVVDPTGGAAGFHDDEVAFGFLKTVVR